MKISIHKKAYWKTKTLGDICDIQTGKWDANHAVINGKYRFYTCAYKYTFCNTKRFVGECLILPGNGVNVGEIFYYQGKFDAYQRTYVINNIKISPKILYYQLLCFWKERNLNKQFGSATNYLKIGNFLNYEIYYPESRSEQYRIVKVLDKVFEKTVKIKENSEKNLQNSKNLFESYLQSIFTNPGKDWEEKRFDEIIKSNVIGLVKNIKEQSAYKKYKYVKMNNITRDNNFDFSKYTRVNATKEEVEKYNLIKGDFLFNTRNSYELVGKTCIFEGNDEKDILFNNNIMRVRFTKTCNSHFINYAFSSRIIINKIKHFKSGTTNVSAIYYKDLKTLVLPIPSITVQNSIVSKLDALSTETKRLESIYKQKLADLEELKRSILKSAFNGEL